MVLTPLFLLLHMKKVVGFAQTDNGISICPIKMVGAYKE